ncbi:hypothetical protein IW140_002321 [Coemansia sp. RSA 1813]|nr:hypothetical protein IW140_002321 [Coemansia sp. RSA 1813]
MLSANAFGNRFNTYHHGPGGLERSNGAEDEEDEELLASIRPPSVLFGAEIMPLRPYVPWKRSTTPRRAPTPISSATQSMKRDNRPPSMDLFVATPTPMPAMATAPPVAGETTPTGFLDSEMPPVSPFFARITPGDIEEARETVRRASVSRRNTIGTSPNGRGVSWCSPTTADSAKLQAIATPARTSIAGTLAGWVPLEQQRWDPQTLETPSSRSRIQRQSFGRRHSTWHLLEDDARSNGSTESACEWLKDQEPPLSPLFTSYNTARLKATKDQPSIRRPQPPSLPLARQFQVDVYALFTSPLYTRQQRKPRVVVREIVGGETGNVHLVPVDASDPDVLAAVKRYLTTLPPFDRRLANDPPHQHRRDPTKMTVPSKRNSETITDGHFSEPTISFIVSSSNTAGVRDKPVRSVDVEAMVEAYLPNVYALLDADRSATPANNVVEQKPAMYHQQQQHQRPLSLGEETLHKVSRLPIAQELRNPRDDPVLSAANNATLATPSRPPRLKQPIRSIDQLREAMSSLNLRRGLSSKEIGRKTTTTTTTTTQGVGMPTVLTRRPSEPPRIYQQRNTSSHQQQQQQQQQQPETQRPMVLRRRSEVLPQASMRNQTMMALGCTAPPVSASKTLPTLTRRTVRPQASFPANRRSSEEVQLLRNSSGSLSSMILSSPSSRASLSSDHSYTTPTASGTRPPAPSYSSTSPLIGRQQQRPRAKSSRLDLRSRRDMTPLAPIHGGDTNDSISNARARNTGTNMTKAMNATARPLLTPASSSSSSLTVPSSLTARRSMINMNTSNRLSLGTDNGSGGRIPYNIQHRASYTLGSTDRLIPPNSAIGTPTRLPPTARRALSGDSQYSSGAGIPNGSTPRSSVSSGYYPMSAPPVRRSIDEPPPLVNGGMMHQIPRKPSRRYRLDIRGVFGGDTKDSPHNSLGVYPFC